MRPTDGRQVMRIVLSDFISLDGVVQAPGGRQEDTDGGFEHGGWSMKYFDAESMGTAIDEAMANTDALLFGRRTWQVMAGAWPGRAGDPFADRMNEITKYVASRTLTEDDLTWTNSHLLPPDDVWGSIEKLKAQEGGDIQVMGSASLARDLVAKGLVDEYNLMIEPVVLGGGKRLFPDDGTRRDLELVSSTTSSTGVHICKYRTLS
jgi:dihydrofolate reductase